jgi:HPt (histidine-containing phosphotransfer) domain-containing protein
MLIFILADVVGGFVHLGVGITTLPIRTFPDSLDGVLNPEGTIETNLDRYSNPKLPPRPQYWGNRNSCHLLTRIARVLMQLTQFMDYPAYRHPMTHSSNPARSALPIDWKQLQQLSEGNEEFELELLQIFLTETTKLLQRAQYAILHHDRPQLAHAAHQMKGGSGNIGMTEMARLCRELETMTQAENWEQAEQQVEAIARSLNYVANYLQTP